MSVGTFGSAAAQDTDPSRVAVLVLAVDGQDAETADGLTEVLIGAVAARGSGVEIIGKEEFQAQLNQGEERSLECVSNTACLGRVGVQLRVDEVVAGTLRRRDEKWVFNLNRIHIESGEVAGRAFREVDGDLGALAAALTAAAAELYEAPTSRLRISVSVAGADVVIDDGEPTRFSGEPIERAEIEAGSHTVEVVAEGYQRWRRVVSLEPGEDLRLEAGLVPIAQTSERGGVSPVFWVGFGLMIAGGGAAATFGVLSGRDPDQGLTRAASVEFTEARRNEALYANIGFAVLGAGAITALIGLLVSDFGGDDEVSPEVSLGPGMLQIGLRGAL